jgi:hypothetical protein
MAFGYGNGRKDGERRTQDGMVEIVCGYADICPKARHRHWESPTMILHRKIVPRINKSSSNPMLSRRDEPNAYLSGNSDRT